MIYFECTSYTERSFLPLSLQIFFNIFVTIDGCVNNKNAIKYWVEKTDQMKFYWMKSGKTAIIKFWLVFFSLWFYFIFIYSYYYLLFAFFIKRKIANPISSIYFMLIPLAFHLRLSTILLSSIFMRWKLVNHCLLLVTPLHI